MIADLAVINHHENARILCNHLIAQCQTLQDITAFVALPLIREHAPEGATFDSQIDSYPNPANFRYAMSYHLFSEWQTATRIRLTRAVCEEAIQKLEKQFAFAGITPTMSNPRIAISMMINNL